MKLVSSIVLYKHSENQTSQLITKLLSSTLLSKLVVIDNGGCSWASKLADNRVFYINSHGNIGYGAGHNLAIRRFAADCDFFLICNPDIEVSPAELDHFCLQAEKEGAVLFMPEIRYPDGRRQYLCKLLPTPLDLFLRRFMPSISRQRNKIYELQHADYSKPFFSPSLSGCFMLIRSTALLAVGGFDERYFMYLEDTDLSRRLARYGNALYLPNITVTHHFQKSSYKNLGLLLIHIRSAILYFNKWGWFFDRDRSSLNKMCLNKLPSISSTNSIL
ncbi:glycosyltransferase family 2 protein [Vogesella indigofera]|uniref:glycosyltransferase family 2 protein n=1 Tax=Vogesella indigofera TaxID=45465 RepID=UPI00234E9CCC|nr:glycosyltransferase family 2 protein [Vogesella indigofera]MDC7711984.1 glycosyltransferase family 2 protein [Vogesella indigofera]